VIHLAYSLVFARLSLLGNEHLIPFIRTLIYKQYIICYVSSLSFAHQLIIEAKELPNVSSGIPLYDFSTLNSNEPLLDSMVPPTRNGGSQDSAEMIEIEGQSHCNECVAS
jgi:hypothetical protein